MKLQNTRLGAYNGIEVGAVIDVEKEEVKGYLEVGFTEYVEKEEAKAENAPVVANSGTVTESKKTLSEAKAQAEKIVVDAKLEAGKIVSDAKLEADEIKKDATDEAAKIVAEATPKTEVTENKEVSGDVKDTKTTTTQK